MEASGGRLVNNFLYRRPVNMSISEWRENISNEWKSLNERKGLHQLCQDPTHYYINTLIFLVYSSIYIIMNII